MWMPKRGRTGLARAMRVRLRGRGCQREEGTAVIKARYSIPSTSGFVRRSSVEFGYADHRPLRLSTRTPTDGAAPFIASVGATKRLLPAFQEIRKIIPGPKLAFFDDAG